MPDLWLGPNLFRFEQIVIDRVIPRGETGNYALGFKDDAGQFVPKFIGRSDSDLRSELTARLATTKYPYFKFSPGNPGLAFQTESAQYHNYRGQLDNKAHPASPVGSGLKCFLCGL